MAKWDFRPGSIRVEAIDFGNGVVLKSKGGATTLTFPANIVGPLTIDAGGLTVTAGGATVTAGGLTVTAGGVVLTAGVLSVDTTTDTSSTITGSIHTDGGVGIAKALWVGTTSQLVGAVTMPGALTQGADSTDAVGIKGIYMNPSVDALAVPSITDPDIAIVVADVSGNFSYAPAVGDAVIAIPNAALPTNCLQQGAWVSGADEISVSFGSQGGNVTGANVNYSYLCFDLT